ncbi:MAG: hypothetical protein ACKOZL_08325, partial [Actinomycetes bacterium]
MTGVEIDFFSMGPGGGLEYLTRYAHVVFGVAWIGLLYYFNFVQVPAFAEMEAAARNNAIDKLASRALWWFRWAAVATVVSGILILWAQKRLSGGEYFKSPAGIAIATGILLALTMFVNVWGIIWRNQKVVIANARNVQAGGEADPAAAGAGRKALLASRQNVIYSLPMLAFMVGTSHFGAKGGADGSQRGLYWGITALIWILFELNALGVFGKDPGGTRKIYDTHKAAIVTGVVYLVVQLGL